MENYLNFDTTSMQEFIIDKLNTDGKFSDQIYPGSDLSVLIDIFSAMYSCLTYTLNVNATESIFTDAQYYESMNRLVKMLNYNPHGLLTSMMLTNIDLSVELKTISESYFPPNIITLPKYTTLTLTNLTDKLGNQVKYSLVKDFSVFSRGKIVGTKLSEFDTIIDADNMPLFYNGEWVYYNKRFIAGGTPFEVHFLNSLPDDVNIAYPFIHVYIEDTSGKYTQYLPVTNIFNSSPFDKHFEVRINENKIYELKFGDGINARRLLADEKIHVMYLRSNEKLGEISKGFLKNTIDGIKEQSLSVGIEGISEVFLKEKILDLNTHSEYISFGNAKAENNDGAPHLRKLKITNSESSSQTADFESVDEIRTNAPNSVRMGNRVITHQDFKQYILNQYKNIVLDIVVMNNYEYMSEFQYWLDEYNKLELGVRYFNYKFADSCDFNDIHLFMRSRKQPSLSGGSAFYLDNDTLKIIERDLNSKKPLTSEILFPNPVEKVFTPCLVNNTYSIFNWDAINDDGTGYPENMFVIFRDRNTLITKESIIQNVINIVSDYFDINNTLMGMTVDPSNIYNKIMAVTGIKSVKTRYWSAQDRYNGDVTKQQWFDGLSFATFTPFLIEGADVQIISGPFKLNSFQFPSLKDASYIKQYIEVVSEKYSIAELEY